jgi:hypothetical protein
VTKSFSPTIRRITLNAAMCGEVNFLVWRWHGEVCVPQARAIWPESQAWLGYGMAITLGPSLRSSISVTLFASIQGVGASPYKKSRATFAGHVLEKQYGSASVPGGSAR